MFEDKEISQMSAARRMCIFYEQKSFARIYLAILMKKYEIVRVNINFMKRENSFYLVIKTFIVFH